jgi:hypothetical protein
MKQECSKWKEYIEHWDTIKWSGWLYLVWGAGNETTKIPIKYINLLMLLFVLLGHTTPLSGLFN